MDPLCLVSPEAHHMVIACVDFGCACVANGPVVAANTWAELRQALLA